MRHQKRNAVGWLSLSVLLLCGACADQDPVPGVAVGERDPAARDSEIVTVVTAPVRTETLGTAIEAVGTAMANESVQVTSKSTNTITAIRFGEGARVSRGTVLIEFNAAEIRAEVAEAEAALAESESQFKRSRSLASEQALSASQLETVEATLKANRARLDAARARLEDTVIRAGFDGRTGLRNVSVGALITPGTIITTLDDTSVIKLNFTVPEANLSALEQGLEVTATTVGLPGRAFKGRITQVDSRVDPVSRSILVRAEIPNVDRALRPGMFMSVALAGRPSPALLVPEGAIVPEQGSAFAFVVRDGRVERREVRTGRRRPGDVEIVSGLQPGEKVVVEGTQNVNEGSQVREQASTPPADAPARQAS
jgi:membrane fusion protein (multidrug efflux system)